MTKPAYSSSLSSLIQMDPGMTLTFGITWSSCIVACVEGWIRTMYGNKYLTDRHQSSMKVVILLVFHHLMDDQSAEFKKQSV
jgi:hypothetical protein